jgi:hypothetical protein
LGTCWEAILSALLALVAAEDLEIHLMDVKTAYRHGEQSVWMRPSPGYRVGPPGTVCRLQKATYGLKQASRAWQAALRRILGGADLQPACSDPGLFVQRVPGKDGRVYVLASVDDLLIVGDCAAIQRVWMVESNAVNADLGEARWFLGMEVARECGRKQIFLSQGWLIRHMLERFGLADCKAVSTPLDPGAFLAKGGIRAADCRHAEMVGCILTLQSVQAPTSSLQLWHWQGTWLNQLWSF